MANYNFAQGGDIHYNENMALYPQNAFIKDRPEFGWSETLLKPAHHWEGGHYSPVRHLNFSDKFHNIGLVEAAKDLKQGDTFLTHVIPTMSLITDIHYVVHTPYAGSVITAKFASSGTTIGTIDTATANDAWITLETPLYVPSDTNEGIEFVLTTWPEAEESDETADPCGVYGPCTSPVPLCMTVTAFYKHARAEEYCGSSCLDMCGY